LVAISEVIDRAVSFSALPSLVVTAPQS
jgi:hypothetical protein